MSKVADSLKAPKEQEGLREQDGGDQPPTAAENKVKKEFIDKQKKKVENNDPVKKPEKNKGLTAGQDKDQTNTTDSMTDLTGEIAKERDKYTDQSPDVVDKFWYIYEYRITFLSLVALPIIAGLVLLCFYPHADIPKSKTYRLEMFSRSLGKMTITFPNQTQRFWRILRNRVNAHLKSENPKKPLVLMFAAPPPAHDVLKCIARKIAQSIEPENDELEHINGYDFNKYSSPDDAKKILDDRIEQRLQASRTAVLVLNVELLPAQASLLFYEYCDNENAPYKDAAIMFTVRLPEEPSSSLIPAKAEGLVGEYLNTIWGKQVDKQDEIPPLVSRMTDTVVLVNGESEKVIKTNCGS